MTTPVLDSGNALHHSAIAAEQAKLPKRGADIGDGSVTYNERLGHHVLSGNATPPKDFKAPPVLGSSAPVASALPVDSPADPGPTGVIVEIPVEPLNDAAKANEEAAG